MSDAASQTVIDFSATGLVSIFLRHPTPAAHRRQHAQRGPDRRPAMPPKSRGSGRSQINKNLRSGYDSLALPRPGDDPPSARLLDAATSRRCPHRAPSATSSPRRLLRSHPRSPHLAGPSPPPTGRSPPLVAASSDGYLVHLHGADRTCARR
jgi:hypothetical protein